MDSRIQKNLPLLFDTHSHLNFNVFKNDSLKIIKECLDDKVWTILVGSQFDTSKRALEYAQKYDYGIYCSVGLHPAHLKEMKIDESESDSLLKFKTRAEKFDPDKYKNLIIKDKTVAIGEIGLDYIFDIKESDKKLQEEEFVKQIYFALDYKLPVIIHCRDAYKNLTSILYAEFKNKNLRGVAHFFSGTLNDAKKFLDLGFYLSFSGPITFAPDRDESIKYAPLDKILIETDSPYAAPAPFRGKRNIPIYVKFVAQRISEIRGITFEEVSQITTQNALELFNIKIGG